MRKTSLFSKWLRALQRNNFKITATWEYIRIFCRLFDFSRRMILKKSRKCRKGLCSAEFWSSSSWQCRRKYISCSLSPCWVSGVNLEQQDYLVRTLCWIQSGVLRFFNVLDMEKYQNTLIFLQKSEIQSLNARKNQKLDHENVRRVHLKDVN